MIDLLVIWIVAGCAVAAGISVLLDGRRKGVPRKICYIVGAGLTKSLETSGKFRVPLMVDFVKVLADHIDSNVVLTALTNFEKGRVFDWSRPEWIALAEKLDTTSSVAERERYADILRRRPSENVEQLLRNAVQKRKGSLYASIVEDRFGFAINAVFSRIAWNLRMDVLIRYLRRQFSLPNTTHTFVSYNYDLVLDCCIRQAVGERWSPESGYAISFTETARITDAMGHMKQFTHRGGGAYGLFDARPAKTIPGDGNIVLLKPHGSLNWLVPFEGNYNFKNEDPLLLLGGEEEIAYYDTFTLEQIRNTRKPAEIAFNAAIFITPPLDEKTAAPLPDFVRTIEERSLAALRDADEVVVIGWSMPSTDKAEVDRLKRAMNSAREGRSLTAVNFNADAVYFARLADVCHVAPENMRVFNAGFVDFVSNQGDVGAREG